VSSRETWPTVLDELAKLIGEKLTLQLAEREGGIDRVYIPKKATIDHPWAKILGTDAWHKVVATYGGERIDLPRGTRIKLKKVEILELAEQGISRREIARRVRTTERHVRRVLGLLSVPLDEP